VEFLRIPLHDHVVHEAFGHLHLARLHFRGLRILRGLDVVRVANLVLVAQRVEHEQLALRIHGRQMLPGADHHVGDRDAPGALQRLPQQGIALLAVLARCEVVGRLEVVLRDVARVHEAHDVDALRGFHIGALEVFLLQQHVLAVFPLVALHDLLVGHLVPGVLVEALVAHGSEVAAVQHGEAQLLALFRGVQGHRDVHETEIDGPFPKLAWHVRFLLAEVRGSDDWIATSGANSTQTINRQRQTGVKLPAPRK